MARTLKHGVQFTEGTFFGEGGEGFLRGQRLSAPEHSRVSTA